MKKLRYLLVLSLAMTFCASVSRAVPVAASGAVAGEWTADWTAARALAKANNTYYFILVSKPPSGVSQCAYCNAAENGIWSQQAFKDWTKANGIPLVYANAVNTGTEPVASVIRTYPGIVNLPTLLIVSGAGTGKTLIKMAVIRYGWTISGVKINLSPENFIDMVQATVGGGSDDKWDKTATLAGDETVATASALPLAETNAYHGVHTLNNSDTNDWFSLTGLASGQRYRLSVTNFTAQNATPLLSIYTSLRNAADGASSTNVPLAQLTSGFYYAAETGTSEYVRVWRTVTNGANVSYTLNYRKASLVPHALTVSNGVGAVVASEGDTCPVAADAKEDQQFMGWAVNPAGAVLGAGFNAAQPNGSVLMPPYDVTLTAKYQAITRIVALSGNLAFGNVMTNRSVQRVLTVANTGNRVLSVSNIVCPAGFAATPTQFAINPGVSQSVTITFTPDALGDYTGSVAVASDKTSGDEVLLCTGKGIDNTPPQLTSRTPAGNPAAINEGGALAFSLKANDTVLDTEVATRGMASIVWSIDGAQKLVTSNGAPGAMTSSFSLRTSTTTVQGVMSNSFKVTAAAVDKQGGRSETSWTIWVRNLRQSQTLTFPAPPVKVVGDIFDLNATSTSRLAVEYTSSNVAVVEIVDGKAHVVGPGSATITARQPGNADYLPAVNVQRVITVRLRVSAVASPTAGGTVRGAGVYAPGTTVTLVATPAAGYTFLRWENGSQTSTRSLVLRGNLAAEAIFGRTADVPAPVLGNPGTQLLMVGVVFSLPLDVTSESLPTVTASGLPSGLTYSASLNVITGVPSLAVAGKTVTLTAKNVNRNVTTQRFDMVVENLPQWAWGSFNGACEHDDLGPGVVSMAITSLGKVSGTVKLMGTNYPFSAASFVRRDSENAFWFTTQAQLTTGTVKLPLTFKVSQAVPAPVNEGGNPVPETLSMVEGWFGNPEDSAAAIALYRDVWRDAGMAMVVSNFMGYYTATLPVQGPALEMAGSSYLTFTVDAAGTVTTAGKLADGTAFSQSGKLILDSKGRVWTVFYAVPVAYRGGAFFGSAELFRPEGGVPYVRLLDDVLIQWENRNPLATDLYGDGFMYSLGLVGGWYDKIGNLNRYYQDQVLTVRANGADSLEVVASGEAYATAFGDPTGLPLTVVTNTAGVMTGLKAPAVNSPVATPDGWDYESKTNVVGLSVTLTRATGTFAGAFKAWFDYGTTHTYKTIAYSGVLTPERENPLDGVEGRGFYTWPGRSSYLTATREIAYSYTNSFDFVIESAASY